MRNGSFVGVDDFMGKEKGDMILLEDRYKEETATLEPNAQTTCFTVV